MGDLWWSKNILNFTPSDDSIARSFDPFELVLILIQMVKQLQLQTTPMH